MAPDRSGEQARSGDRRSAMAEAAIAIVARDGLRALTHRAVDRELDLPPGSTSYYLRTHRQLVEAMVHQLADRTAQDVDAGAPVPTGPAERASADDIALAVSAALERLAARPDDHLVRWALVVDLTRDPELQTYLTNRSPVRSQLLARAAQLLERMGVTDPGTHAPGLVALVDGLLFDRLAGGSASGPPTDTGAVIRAYLRGLPRAT